MKQSQPPEERTHPEELLGLWLGHIEVGTPPPPKRRSLTLLAVLLLLGLVAVAALLKFAVDVLGIVFALVAVGVLLHFLGIRLAESNILSPGWLLIILLGLALSGYALFVPASSVAGIGRYMPKWMVAAFAWTEDKGWGQRVLVGPGDAGRTSPMVDGGPAANRPTETIGTTSIPASVSPLSLVASSGTSVQGQPVTLMARLPAGEAVAGPVSVRFYDGLVILGTADMKGNARGEVAYLTVRGLAIGRHEFTAAMVGPLGLGSSPSRPIEHTVVGRR